MVTTLAGRTPGLVSLEPGTEVERSLVSELQTHSEGETGYYCDGFTSYWLTNMLAGVLVVVLWSMAMRTSVMTDLISTTIYHYSLD